MSASIESWRRTAAPTCLPADFDNGYIGAVVSTTFALGSIEIGHLAKPPTARTIPAGKELLPNGLELLLQYLTGHCDSISSFLDSRGDKI